jgi:hypothetical protein
MQLSILAVFSLVALAFAAPTPIAAQEGKFIFRSKPPTSILTHSLGLVVRAPVDAEAASMSAADGTIVPFDSTKVGQ